MSFNWDKKVRPELTLEQCQAIVDMIEQVKSDCDPVLLEVSNKYTKQILLEQSGLLVGSGIKRERPPARNSLAGLEFDTEQEQSTNSNNTGNINRIPVRKIRSIEDKSYTQLTQEEKQSFEDNLMAKMRANEENNKKILEEGGKLPTLNELFINPEFKFGED